jgi:hypothetical protein
MSYIDWSMQIDRGHFGDIPLDGLRRAVRTAWPGPIHKGGGTFQMRVHEGAALEQRHAIEAVGQGGETSTLAGRIDADRGVVR